MSLQRAASAPASLQRAASSSSELPARRHQSCLMSRPATAFRSGQRPALPRPGRACVGQELVASRPRRPRRVHALSTQYPTAATVPIANPALLSSRDRLTAVLQHRRWLILPLRRGSNLAPGSESVAPRGAARASATHEWTRRAGGWTAGPRPARPSPACSPRGVTPGPGRPARLARPPLQLVDKAHAAGRRAAPLASRDWSQPGGGWPIRFGATTPHHSARPRGRPPKVNSLTFRKKAARQPWRGYPARYPGGSGQRRVVCPGAPVPCAPVPCAPGGDTSDASLTGRLLPAGAQAMAQAPPGLGREACCWRVEPHPLWLPGTVASGAEL